MLDVAIRIEIGPFGLRFQHKPRSRGVRSIPASAHLRHRPAASAFDRRVSGGAVASLGSAATARIQLSMNRTSRQSQDWNPRSGPLQRIYIRRSRRVCPLPFKIGKKFSKSPPSELT
jgi:hypothetical protein